MAVVLTMPAIVADATEAVLHDWFKTVGESFIAGEAIAEIETEKATVELEAEADGVLARIIAAPGASVAVGAPIAVIAQPGEDEAEIERVLAAAGLSGAADATGSTGSTEVAPAGTPAQEASDASAPAAGAEAPAQGERLFASPLARRLARESGVSLSALSGSGPSGRIIREDVERAIREGAVAQPAAAPAAVPAPAAPSPAAPAPGAGAPAALPEGAERVELTRMRQAIARRLTESKTQVPHFYLTVDVRMDELLALRARLNATGGQKITVNDLVVRAIGQALIEVPEANVGFGGDHLIRYDRADISVAIATEGGLLTPVVRGVESMSVGALSAQIADYARRAQIGKIRPEEIQGGSFSVSNLGMYGTKEFSAILNPPQAGILAVGAAQPRAVVVDGELAVATVMTCTLSADHRAIDGAVAATLMRAFARRIEDPVSILI